MSYNLNWSVEAACLNAWPATRQTILDGWALRASGGPTRRANSANPLDAGAGVSEALIAQVESFYAGQGRPTIFRVPDMVSGDLDRLLAARGYALDAPTRTLCADLSTLPMAASDSVETATSASPDWLDARDRMSDADEAARRSSRAIIGAIRLPSAFVALSKAGKIVSLAFGVRQDDLLILESVLADPDHRRQGLAAQCLSRLIIWAKAQGCTSAALQVMADNTPALALYRRLGFTRDLYGYHYRIKR